MWSRFPFVFVGSTCFSLLVFLFNSQPPSSYPQKDMNNAMFRHVQPCPKPQRATILVWRGFLHPLWARLVFPWPHRQKWWWSKSKGKRCALASTELTWWEFQCRKRIQAPKHLSSQTNYILSINRRNALFLRFVWHHLCAETLSMVHYSWDGMPWTHYWRLSPSLFASILSSLGLPAAPFSFLDHQWPHLYQDASWFTSLPLLKTLLWKCSLCL